MSDNLYTFLLLGVLLFLLNPQCLHCESELSPRTRNEMIFGLKSVTDVCVDPNWKHSDYVTSGCSIKSCCDNFEHQYIRTSTSYCCLSRKLVSCLQTSVEGSIILKRNFTLFTQILNCIEGYYGPEIGCQPLRHYVDSSDPLICFWFDHKIWIIWLCFTLPIFAAFVALFVSNIRYRKRRLIELRATDGRKNEKINKTNEDPSKKIAMEVVTSRPLKKRESKHEETKPAPAKHATQQPVSHVAVNQMI